MDVTKIAAVLCSLDEMNGVPESMLYIFFGMDIHLWNDIRNSLVRSDLIAVKGNYVTLTSKGKALAQRINKQLEQ